MSSVQKSPPPPSRSSSSSRPATPAARRPASAAPSRSSAPSRAAASRPPAQRDRFTSSPALREEQHTTTAGRSEGPRNERMAANLNESGPKYGPDGKRSDPPQMFDPAGRALPPGTPPQAGSLSAAQHLSDRVGPDQFKNLYSADEKVRKQAVSDLSQQLAGDPEARAQLSHLANDPRHAFTEDQNLQRNEMAQQQLRTSALDTFGQMHQQGVPLTAQEVDTLSGALTDTEAPGEAASRLFGKLSKGGDANALHTVRDASTSDDGRGTAGRAADSLAQAAGTKNFLPSDYGRLLIGSTLSHGTGSGQQAFNTLRDGVKADRSGALSEVRKALGEGSESEQNVAAQMLGQVPGQQSFEDTQALGQLVGSAQSDTTATNALGALQAGALHEKPAPGAAKALNASLDGALARGERLQQVSSTHQEVFSKSPDLGVKDELAPHVMKIPGARPEASKAAIQRLGERARTNPADKAALNGLSAGLKNEGLGYDAPYKIAEVLGDAAAAKNDGARQLLADTLKPQLGNHRPSGHFPDEQREEKVSWAGAAGLARAAQGGDTESLKLLQDGYNTYKGQGPLGDFAAPAAMWGLGQVGANLKPGDPSLASVRTSLRGGLENGDSRAASAMGAMSANLKPEDHQALLGALDNEKLAGPAYAALSQAADTMDPAARRGLLDRAQADLSGGNSRYAQGLMATRVPELKVGDVNALSARLGQSQGDEQKSLQGLLSRTMTRADDADARMASARTLAKPENFKALDPYSQRDLDGFAKGSGNAELKDLVHGQLDTQTPERVQAWQDRIKGITDIQDPVQRNRAITEGYYDISNKMQGLLGGDAGANWSTWAAHASDQAGEHMVPNSLDGFGVIPGNTANSRKMVADGNRKVFQDIAPHFGRFIETFQNPENRNVDGLRRFNKGFEGLPDHENLQKAFGSYYQALKDPTTQARREHTLNGNLLAGFHEQTMLQPEIEGAIPYGLHRGATFGMMNIRLPKESLSLWNDVTPLNGREFPQQMEKLQDPGLLETIGKVDAAPNTLNGSGAWDWTNFDQRMNFIADLFRSRHLESSMFDHPRR